jgi:hypothetical protein
MKLPKSFTQSLDSLVNSDQAKKSMQSIVDMPDRKIDLFIKLCLQNEGHLSSSKRQRFFSMLEDSEIEKLEHAVQKYRATRSR